MRAPTRRAVLGGAVAVPALAAAAMVPGIAQAECPTFAAAYREYVTAEAAVNHAVRLGDDPHRPAVFDAADKRMGVAWRALLVAVPTTWAQFVQLLDAMTEGGTDTTPTQEASAHLLACARRLIGEASE